MYLPPHRESAFFGLLQAHQDLTRAIDQALLSEHGISLSTYEILNRLAHADEGRLRITTLAEKTPLSLSRVSRLVDELALRGMAERKACPEDKRASHVFLTAAGRALMKKAQKTFYATAEERFFGHLSRAETEQLAEIFGRLTGGESGCKTALG